MDRQIRVWERTKDMVFVEEEREREMEDMFDKVGHHQNEVGTDIIMRRKRIEEELEEDREDEDRYPQSEAAVRRSVISVASGDRIMEALERADQELKDLLAFRKKQETNGGTVKDRPPNPLLLGMKPAEYMLWVLRSVKSSELEQSLLVLPLHHMERLIFYLIVLLREGLGIELCSRAAVFLVKTHQNQLVGYSKLSTPLRELRRLLRQRLSEARDSIGYNLAAIRLIQKAAQEHKGRYRITEYKEDEMKPIFTSKNLGIGSAEAEAVQRKSIRRSN
jgi:U3 small nucleolar RNA-associated protein 12